MFYWEVLRHDNTTKQDDSRLANLLVITDVSLRSDPLPFLLLTKFDLHLRLQERHRYTCTCTLEKGCFTVTWNWRIHSFKKRNLPSHPRRSQDAQTRKTCIVLRVKKPSYARVNFKFIFRSWKIFHVANTPQSSGVMMCYRYMIKAIGIPKFQRKFLAFFSTELNVKVRFVYEYIKRNAEFDRAPIAKYIFMTCILKKITRILLDSRTSCKKC
jgi:hypothetical protein